MKSHLVLIAGLLLANTAIVRAGCTIDEVANETQFREIKRASELAQQAKRALHTIEEVGSHAKDPNKSIGDQLSKNELDEFSQARGRYQAIELLQTIEAIYERDIRVIRGIYEVAQDKYLGKPDPQKKDPNYLNFVFLGLARAGSEDPQMKPNYEDVALDSTCSMGLAIQRVENEAFGRLSKFSPTAIQPILEQMKARNGGKLDRATMRPDDRAKFDELQRTVIAPGSREMEFINNLEAAKLLAVTAELRYETLKKQATDSGGDVSSTINVFNGMDLPPRTKLGFFVLDKIGEKVPNEHAQTMSAIAPFIDAVKKADAAHLAKQKKKDPN
jgi:hypothetical protein